MKNHICPFCNASIPDIQSTYRTKKCFFNMDVPHIIEGIPMNNNIIEIQMLFCPTCKEVSFFAKGESNLKDVNTSLYPNSLAKQFPDYVPSSIRQDYEEAYSILDLSPKASATLSRRCLQGMIRDFWEINKSNLYQEISALQKKVPVDQWKAIDALRSLGNIGAHMEKDVNIIIDIEPDEAQKLLNLIELLIDKWYVAQHDEQELLNKIVSIKEDKLSQKVSN